MQGGIIVQKDGGQQAEGASEESVSGEGMVMEKRFHVSVHRNSENVHLKLFGVFGDLSALELNDLIDRYAGNVNKIFIHTEALKQVLSIGKTVFHKRLVPGTGNLVFTGRHAAEFLTNTEAPSGQSGPWAALR